MPKVEKKVEVAEAMRQKTDDELMSLYIQMRDAVAEESRKFKEKMAKVNSLMEQIEGVLLQRLIERGADSTSSATATAFTTTATFCNVDDWDKALAFVLETGQYQFLNHSISKAAVAEYMEEHKVEAEDGTVTCELPPGVKWTEERVLQIRRK